tara:strand:- start:177 stop:311 length:135 start_codon:yes stop_codon:yes gene_type:complete
MSLKYLSKDKEERRKQLVLLMNNCRIFGIKPKQELIDEYNKLNN